MKAKLKRERDSSSSSLQTEAVVDLLIDARPDEILLAPDTADRIFESALRESIASNETPRMALAGTRLVLSAAFCICAGAGLLLIHSMASVRSAGSHNGNEPGIAFRAQSAKDMAAIGTRAPLQGTHQSSIKIASLAHITTVTVRAAISDIGIGVRLTYTAPPVPVCGMTTFAIFTPVSAVTAQRTNRESAGDCDAGSLLVCVVSTDDPIVDDTTIESSSFDSQKNPISSVTPILVGAACGSYNAESTINCGDAFIKCSASAGQVLSMPDYIAI